MTKTAEPSLDSMPIFSEPPIKAVSFSRIKQFEKCPFSVYLGGVIRLPRPEQDENAPNVRGNKIHKQAEDFIQGVIEELPSTLSKFENELNHFRQWYGEGFVQVEEDWGFDKDWGVTGYFDDNVWMRIKCDVVVKLENKAVRIIDWKTGKSMGNEVTHAQQGQVYAAAVFFKYPDVDTVSAEFMYTDEGKTKKKIYSREKIMRLMGKINERAQKVTNCRVFTPKPNKYNCKWCDYGSNKGTSACPHSVEI